MIVGVAQVSVKECQLKQNVKEHLSILHEATLLKCRYVVFPELSITGYFLDQLNKYNKEVIEELIIDFRCFAIDKKINFTIGVPLWMENRVMIGALTFLENGNVLEHHKRELYGDEVLYVAKGVISPQFQIDGVSFSVCICAELNNKRFFDDAMLSGSSVYSVSALVTKVGFSKEISQLQSYASQGVNVLFANHAQKQGDFLPVGQSTIFNHWGEEVARANSNDILITADIQVGIEN